MKVIIVNKIIKVGKIEVAGIGSSSVILVGDTETIVNSSYFDTPSNSLIISSDIKPINSATPE